MSKTIFIANWDTSLDREPRHRKYTRADGISGRSQPISVGKIGYSHARKFGNYCVRRAAFAALLLIIPSVVVVAGETAPEITVYAAPNCSCCRNWMRYLQISGFRVDPEFSPDMEDVKSQLGIPMKLEACHSAVVGGYLIEGHVPAEDIARLLRERPPIRGLAVPGMPVGSPGMEHGSDREHYNVYAFTEGDVYVFSAH